MDDPKDSPLNKAEESAKRVLERLGSTIDKKVLGRSGSDFGADYAAALASRIEKSIESSLKPDDAGKSKVAPNYFKVSLTYEEASKLTPLQIESLSKDLTASAREFIHNRRYRSQGDVEVEVVSDLFATSTVIKAEFGRPDSSAAGLAAAKHRESDSFEAGSASTPMQQGADLRQSGSGSGARSLTLIVEDGRQYRLDLVRGGPPQYAGRAAGSAIRLDDPSVSRVHCSLAMRNDGEIVISDLDSANGTFVNGRIVNTGEAHTLKAGDDIQIGDVALRVGRLED